MMGRSPEQAGGSTEASRFDVEISVRRLPLLLVGVAVVLMSCHLGLAYYHYRVAELPWSLVQLFDVDQENNLPTWYSGFILLVAVALLWLCARKKRLDGDRWFRWWYLLTAGFLVMAIDEVASLHEVINGLIEVIWAKPAGFLVIGIGVVFLPFVLSLPRRTGFLFVVAGAIYVFGVIGVEIFGNYLAMQRLTNSLEYRIVTMVEESLEMLGVIVFIYALLDYMRGAASHASVSAEIVD